MKKLLPAGPVPTYPDQTFNYLTIPSQAQVWKSGGWTLAGGRQNNKNARQWKKAAKKVAKSNGNWPEVKSKYVESGYYLFGDFTTKASLASLDDYLVVGIQTNVTSTDSLAFLYRQSPPDNMTFSYTYSHMPQLDGVYSAWNDIDGVLGNVLNSTAKLMTCEGFESTTGGCNGLGGVFGHQYKDATSQTDGRLQLWLWLPDPRK